MALFRSGGNGRIVDPRRTKNQDSASPARNAAAPRPPSVFAVPRMPRLAAPRAVEPLETRTLLSTYYVSTSGSDAADGTSLSAPFKTIQQAADVAQPGDTVLVRGGTYRETVTPARSGTSSARITYKPYNGERVTVSGADRVSGWSKYSGSVYQADQGWDLGMGKNQVFVDGKMMIEARWPNTTLDLSHPKKATADDLDVSGGYATLRDSALTQSSGYWDGAIVHFTPGEGWVGQTGKVSSSSPGKIGFSYHSMGRKAGPETGDPYYLTGKFKALDSASEWFRDGDGTLYLWTEKSDDPAGHTVEAKRRDYAFNLSDREYVTLDGFDIFAATIVSNPNSGYLRLTGLNAYYLSHYTVMPDGWEQDHDTGIYLDGNDNVLSDSVIAYSAGHGVMVAGNDNRVENNLVRDTDYNGGDAAAIRVAGSGHVITRNTVYDTARSGIKISNATDLKVTYNLIHDAMLQTTDGGGVYTFGIDGRGTEIAYNKIYNIKTGGFGGTGIFLDNNSSNYNVHHNVVWNVNHALKMNYTSRGHRVYNNTLSGTDDSVGVSSNSRMPGTKFTNNIFTSEAKIAGDASESHNLYESADPRFNNEGGGDFTLRSGSPAIDRGVKASPYTDGYSGDAPDVGALEYGRSAFGAGANLSVKTPPVSPPAIRPPSTGGTGPGSGSGTGTGGVTPGTGTDGGVTPPADGSGAPPVVAEPPPVVGPVVAAPAEGISVVEVTPVKLPKQILGGLRRARGRVRVVLKNEGTAAAAGPVTVTVLASADAAASPDADLALATLTRAVRLKPGASRTLSLRVKFPAPPATGEYVLLATAAGAPVSTKNVAQGAATVHIDLPAVQLVPGAGDGTAPAPLAVKFGGRTVLTVPVTNQGNVPATDPLDLELRVSTDGSLANSLPLLTLDDVRLPVRAGATRPLKLAFDLPPLPGILAGSYVLLVKLATSDQVLASVPFTIS
jgi:hypothetical protein